MEQQVLKIGQKVFKVKMFSLEIECTNFLIFSRYDFLSLLVLVLAALFWFLLLLQAPLMLLQLYFFPKMAYVYILYCLWIIVDRKTTLTTGRRWRFKRCGENLILEAIKNYFSTKLMKTSALPAGQNYLLAAFPHGLTPLNSVLVNFLTNANNVDDKFPEIEFYLAARDIVFLLPFVREFFLAIGTVSCSESSLKHILTSSPSKGVILYPGGGTEMSYVTSGNDYRITSKRRGFIRVALETGTTLVPVFTFGEKNIYGAWRLPIYTSYFGDFIVPKGRGIFQTHFGWIPKQYPVTTVVGKPIHVPKIQNPSKEIIDKYHKKFFDALFELFEERKHTCDEAGAKAKLVML